MLPPDMLKPLPQIWAAASEFPPDIYGSLLYLMAQWR